MVARHYGFENRELPLEWKSKCLPTPPDKIPKTIRFPKYVRRKRFDLDFFLFMGEIWGLSERVAKIFTESCRSQVQLVPIGIERSDGVAIEGQYCWLNILMTANAVDMTSNILEVKDYSLPDAHGNLVPVPKHLTVNVNALSYGGGSSE